MTTMDNTPPEPPVDPAAPVVFTLEQEASPTALALVVASFNPGKDDHVGRIKLLTAALITECEKLRARPPMLDTIAGGALSAPAVTYNAGIERGKRWASMAISLYEEAAMFAVKSLTAVKKT